MKWASAVEKRILREGVPLSEEEMADAQAIGVRAPERVRLLALARVPMPGDLTLKTAAAAIQFLTSATRGLALRYGIFVRSDAGSTEHWSRTNSLIPRNMRGSAGFSPSSGNICPSV